MNVMRILFVCTHNRCRSILAEAIANKLGGDRIEAASAGSHPTAVVHNLTLKHLQERGYSTATLHSKGWDESSAFQPDALITLCDTAAEESCPVWASDAARVHWGLPDPSKISGSDALSRDAFNATIEQLETRIKALSDYQFEEFDKQQLLDCLSAIADEY